MQQFTGSLSFILFFLILTLLCQMLFGEAITQKFLWLVLLSMVVINSDKISSLLGRVKFNG